MKLGERFTVTPALQAANEDVHNKNQKKIKINLKMENSKKKLENVQGTEGTSDVSNQSSTDADAVEKLQSSSLLDDRSETNAVDEHHHHECLDVEKLGNPSSSVLPLQYKELIHEHRDSELNELKRINDSYNQELLLSKNHIKQLTVENNKLRDENIKLKNENIALRTAQNNENKIATDEYQNRINDSELQLNNSNEDDLNDDCWLTIFSYLSMNDMIQVKRVCRKWYQLSQLWFKQVQTLVYHGYFSEMNKLELYKYCYERKIYRSEKKQIDSFDNVISILHSYGHQIKYYEAIICKDNGLIDECQKFVLEWVPKLCENIVNVEILDCSVIFKLQYFEIMATHWKKLEKIDFKRLREPVEENFYNLLRNNKQLKTLILLFFQVDDKCRFNDKLFTYLPTTIQEIDLGWMMISERCKFRHLISASKNLTSLRSFKFSGIHYLSDAAVVAIAHFKSLIHLTLNNIKNYESRKTLYPIANLKSLKSLDLSGNYDLDEGSLIIIAETCIQLEALFLCKGKVLRDEGLAAITKLEKLKCLSIDLENVTNVSIISSCDSLEVLQCSGDKVNNINAIKLLKKATNLRFVDFGFDDKVHNDVLEAANEIANARKNNVLYIIDIFKTYGVDIINTPYFKYISNFKEIPLKKFPEDIRYYIGKIAENNYLIK